MKFTWDPNKAEENYRKHHVTFDEASLAFYDEFAIWEQDKDHPERGVLIGASVGHRVLFVVHVDLSDAEEDVYRIIHARRKGDDMKMATGKIERHRITNPFLDRVRKEGIEIVGDAAPKHGRKKVTNPYLKKEIDRKRHRAGRPTKAEGARPSTAKSVRLPDAIWKKLEAQAAREQISRNAALYQAALIWLQS